MARRAVEGGGSPLRRLLEPTPGRFAGAARLALVCALTSIVTAMYQTPSAALSSYGAFFYAKPDRTTSVMQTVVLLGAIVVIFAMLVPITDLVINHPAWRVAAMAIVSLLMLFLFSASKLGPLANMAALVMGYALDLFGSVHGGEQVTRGILYLLLACAIPAAVSIVVTLSLAPSPRRLVERALAARLRTIVAVLRNPDSAAAAQVQLLLRESESQVDAMLDRAPAERTSDRLELAALRQASTATMALLSALQVMLGSPHAALPASAREAFADALEPAARAVASGRMALSVIVPAMQPSSLDPAAATARAAIQDALASLVPDRTAPAPASAPAAAPAPRMESGFFVADAFSNPEHLRYAVRTTAAAIFCYLTYSLLDWPGIHTALITCYIVGLPTLADSVEKLALRLAGCLLGTGLGIAAMLWIVPMSTSVGALALIVLTGAFAAAWLAAGSPRIAYAGFQMAFAFFLCVLQDSGPYFNLATARDRVIGIVFGNLVAYFVCTHVWPVSVARRIDAGLNTALRRLAQVVRAADRGARARFASQAHAALAATEDDLHLAGYEPASLRPSPRWLRLRLVMVRRATALGGPLLLVALRGEPDAERLARRLERLADPEQEVRAETRAVREDALQGSLEPHLRGLEAAAAAIHQQRETLHAAA